MNHVLNCISATAMYRSTYNGMLHACIAMYACVYVSNCVALETEEQVAFHCNCKHYTYVIFCGLPEYGASVHQAAGRERGQPDRSR